MCSSDLALLALVSCRAVADLLRARHQEHDLLFPQLKVAELRALPLPPVSPQSPAVLDLAEQTARFLAATEGAGGADAEHVAHARAALDAAAERLYRGG